MVNGQLKTAFWDMGDGTTSSAFEVTHTYALAGFYTVTLQTLTWNGCTDQSSIVIHITDSIPNDCTSHFTAKATNNLYEIHFTGYTSSQYSASYMWNFGDPASGTNNMSTSQNPNHTFSAAGTYSVTLSIVDSTNCTSTFSAPVILSLFSNYSLFGQIFAGNQSITACKVQLFSQDYTGSMNILKEITPDSANYYKFDSVSSGIYHILAIPDPGTIYAQQYLPTYFGDAFLWENSTPVVLGQPVNPYLIHLVDFDSISGGDGLINGDLTSGGKSIIVGNQEILILDANNVPVKYMFSLPDGSFSFTGLPYGEYKVYPVITGIRTYPVTVILSESSKTATVVMKISGQSVAGIGDGNPMSSIEMLYPNPVINQLFMSLKSKGEVKIRITDMSGKTVMVKKEQSPASGNLLSLSVFEFEPGLYILIIQDENGYISSRRFIKN
jgi:PKD repeat protein